ncbi:MAG: SsrA-binding protein SmpB [Proteobacteria bacterium]|jgi:SsrA-binding protein|nr:SsrA-binding protein SmpB [Pseudomonadota bacterium]
MEKKIVCQNRKARHDYSIDEIYEAGIVLAGSEVKSLKEGRASLRDSYARVKKEELFLHNMHITPYPFAHHVNLDPTRTRKLLMHKKEIKRLIGKTEEKGYSLIPLSVYLLRGIIKVELALAKGKRKYDKRHALKEREMKRELDELKKRDRS